MVKLWPHAHAGVVIGPFRCTRQGLLHGFGNLLAILLRDGNSVAGSARNIGGVRARGAMDEADFMRRAIALSCQGVGEGSRPFGAVVVRHGRILGEGRDAVVPDRDPTARAEIVAIRAACATLGTHDLTGAVFCTSCEPCRVCLGAAWWAPLREIVYANDRMEAAAIGFDDAAICEEMAAPLAARLGHCGGRRLRP